MKLVNGFYLPKNEMAFAEHLKKNDSYQEAQRNRALSFVNNWNVALDIGANVGLWAKDLTSFFQKTYCFEPNNECFECLKKNINIKKAELHNYALGKFTEKKILFAPDHGTGGSSLVNNVKIGYDKNGNKIYGKFPDEIKKVNVNVVNLDSLKISEIDFIKIDVQGFELEVLEGAVETIKSNNPVICIEEEYPDKSKTLPLLYSLHFKLLDRVGKEHILKR